MGRLIRKGALFTLLLAFCAPAAADPILVFLIGMARDMMLQRAAKAIFEAPAQPPVVEVSTRYPGTMVEPQILRRLIDDSFIYLSDGQRREIFDSLNVALLDPKNAAVRGPMIEYFAERALAVRAVQIRLSQLAYREKEMLAEEFKKELTDLPEEEQKQLGEILRQRLLPVPSDLNQLLLAAFEAR